MLSTFNLLLLAPLCQVMAGVDEPLELILWACQNGTSEAVSLRPTKGSRGILLGFHPERDIPNWEGWSMCKHSSLFETDL